MYCRCLFCIWFIIAFGSAFAQPLPPILWEHSLGGSLDDIAYDVSQDNDGGFILAGGSTSSDGDILKLMEPEHGGNYDYWIAKIDAASNLQWKKHLGGTGSDVASTVFQTEDGGYIVGGSSSSNDVDVTGNHGDFDFWLVKLVAPGTVQWTKCLGGSSYDDFGSLHETSEGGFIICGGSQSNDGDVSGNHGSSDFWLVKTDAQANIQWQKSYGGSGYEKASDAYQCSDGGYIVVGFSESNDGDVTGNHGDYDGWVIRTDASGSLLWQHSIGGTSYDAFKSVVQLNDGAFILCGYTQSNNGDISGNHGGEDVWIVKLDSSGSMLWSRCFGGDTTEECTGVEAISDTTLLFSCYSKSDNGDLTGNYGMSDYWIIETDLDGVLLWQKNFGGSLNDVCYGAKPATDGGFILSGYSESIDDDATSNHGKKDYWAVKLGGTVAVTEIDKKIDPLLIYPQPASSHCYIKFPDEILAGIDELALYFFDVEGRKILTLSSLKQSMKIDCSDWNSGIYFYEVRTNNQLFYSGLLCIQ